ncbi:hypothetical protein L6164_011470 [Bauhinia variegata]|uniref:Uncharacterized protein n=1 Tax=Bauhinia variegata TaxID=167791 RepID=A0ACB9P607_BAUVA|nr:hypothetical protein L6164_011470 [Bauhinia variegata]
MGYQSRRPAWLEALHTQNFFAECSYHENAKKNIYCLDCCTSICPHCLPSHRFHILLRVRRYVYRDVVRLEDLRKLIDCSNVQAYTINSAKVVFIKKRPQKRQFKGSGNCCTSCDRTLQQPFIHCSLDCKVDFVLKHYKDLSPYLRTCNSLQEMGEDEMTNATPSSTIVDSDDEYEPMSSSSSGSQNMSTTQPFLLSTQINDRDMATSMNRRKGIPHRSPLC